MKFNIKKILKAVIVGALSLLSLGAIGVAAYGVTDSDVARHTLKTHSFEQIETTGRASFLDCKGNGAFYRTAFTAVAKDGKTVTGVVCQGAKFTGRKPYISLQK